MPHTPCTPMQTTRVRKELLFLPQTTETHCWHEHALSSSSQTRHMHLHDRSGGDLDCKWHKCSTGGPTADLHKALIDHWMIPTLCLQIQYGWN